MALGAHLFVQGHEDFASGPDFGGPADNPLFSSAPPPAAYAATALRSPSEAERTLRQNELFHEQGGHDIPTQDRSALPSIRTSATQGSSPRAAPGAEAVRRAHAGRSPPPDSRRAADEGGSPRLGPRPGAAAVHHPASNVGTDAKGSSSSTPWAWWANGVYNRGTKEAGAPPAAQQVGRVGRLHLSLTWDQSACSSGIKRLVVWQFV